MFESTKDTCTVHVSSLSFENIIEQVLEEKREKKLPRPTLFIMSENQRHVVNLTAVWAWRSSLFILKCILVTGLYNLQESCRLCCVCGIAECLTLSVFLLIVNWLF